MIDTDEVCLGSDFHADVTLNQLHADQYFEFGDFADGDFTVIKEEIDGKAAIIELQKEGSIKDPESEERISCVISKEIWLKYDIIEMSITGTFKESPEKEDILQRILENLYVAVDIPFFFNGDTTKFLWNSTQVEFKEDKEKDLLEPFQFIGSHFKAYDETYDLNFEVNISSNINENQINKFPIIAYAFTDQGYKKIYQGLCLVPKFKLNKNFEIQLKFKIN